MDSITHIVLGAAIGEAMLGKKIGKKGMLWGALANSLPDIDVIANFFADPVSALLIHRGITHSFFFALIISPLLAYFFYKTHSKLLSYKNCFFFFLVAIIVHDVIDVFTAYGTGLLEPFSHHRFAANSIFVADPLYTLPLIISFITLLILKRNSNKRRMVNNVGIILSSVYLLLTFINKINVDHVMKQNLQEQNIFYTEYMTTPAPLNNALWYMIAKNDSDYYTGYYSIFDSDKKIPFRKLPTNERLLENFPDDPVIEKLKFFSNGFYSINKKDADEIYFNDLRFGQAAGWAKPDSRFVFSYRLKNVADNVVLIKRTELDVSFKEAFKSLWKRMMGN
ncbi:MAG TPA: metal-dependent hydrolase [Bacteroidia bacterium]|nr:metal-dependent hydrolase [Bacteroidia bacterium]